MSRTRPQTPKSAPSTGRGKGRRTSYSEAVRIRADELAADPNLTIKEVCATIASELGVDVPVETGGRWVRETRRRLGVDRPKMLQTIGDRAAVLLLTELERQERLRPHRRDLARIEQVVRTLKTLQAIGPTKRQTGAQTLGDLASDAQAAATPEREGVTAQLRPAA